MHTIPSQLRLTVTSTAYEAVDAKPIKTPTNAVLIPLSLFILGLSA